MHANYSKRLESDYLERLEIWWLRANDWLQPGINHHSVSWNRNGVNVFNIGLRIIITPEDEFVELLYKLIEEDGKEKQIDTQIMLLQTECNYGGTRYWFECPKCYQRVGVLYHRSGKLACRHCQHLTYASKKVNGVEKLTGRIVSDKEIETLRIKVKRKFYNGKLTKKYKRYLGKRLRQSSTIKAIYGLYNRR